MKNRDQLIKAAQEMKLSDLAEKVINNHSFVSGIDDTVLLGRIRMLEVEMIADDIDGFEKELSVLINRHSIDNECATPDYILAEYMVQCMLAYQDALGAKLNHEN